MTQAPPPSPDQPVQAYAQHAADYVLAGWPGVLPVPPATKTPPPEGFTGAEGRDSLVEDVVRWTRSHAGHSIALRMPWFTPPGAASWCVVGIDVDQYEKAGKQKHGATTLAEHEQRWGALPATWSSTARGSEVEPGPSRILMFRAPAQRYATRLVSVHSTGDLAGSTTGDIEVIQRHHRYAVVWPSRHEAIGRPYTWYDPQGRPSAGVPKPEEFAELPPAWVSGLAEGAASSSAASADRASGEILLEQLASDWRPECADVTNARTLATRELERAEAGSRHDAMTSRTHHLVQLGASGHTGVARALEELRALWAQLTDGEHRAEELDRALVTSARKAVTAVGPVQVPRDPCELMAGGIPLPPVPPPALGDPGAPDPELQIVEPARWSSVREVIGTQSFDPLSDTDQPLGQAVLERVYPALRFAYDSGGWLLRTPDKWELHGRLSPWAVAQVAPMMPFGDPGAEKGSEPHAQSKRRTRLLSTAGARAVAGKMDDLVAGGMHPASLALAHLDADPEILWAAGRPWSLRESTEAPVVASIDPTTPHLHTAAMAPQARPTPLWDALLEAVWPDPSIRAWALRVLSIGLTGYADRALPILLGETGRGKTQAVTLIMSVLGSYAHAADPRLMSEAGEKTHASIVFALKGRRWSFIDEGPREGRWAQERLKQLTGGGELTANQMNQNPITFRPTHTLVLTTNDEPVLTDPAIRSRTRLIPCEGDPELVRRTRAAIGHIAGTAWRTEAPGVLAMMMAEAAAWLADPTSALVTAAPEAIRYLAEQVGAEQDPIASWVSEETEPSAAGTPSRELYQAFRASSRSNGTRLDLIPSETKWGKALTRLGHPPVKTTRNNIRHLQLRSGGFMPGMSLPPVADVARWTPGTGHGGLTPTDGGLMEGSSPNPPSVEPQVNPSVSVADGGYGGLKNPPTHMYAPAHTRESRGESGSNPPSALSMQTGDSASDLVEHPAGQSGAQPSIAAPQPTSALPEGLFPQVNLGVPVPDAAETTAKPKRTRKPAKSPEEQDSATAERTEAARLKRLAATEQRRLAAVAERSGQPIGLPAALMRDLGSETPGSARAMSVSLDQAEALLAAITSAPGAELTVDVEHTGYPIGHRDFALRTVQLGNELYALVLDPHDPDQHDLARRHLAAAAVLHAHVANADLVPLAEAGLGDAEDLWARMDDTVVRAKLADPSQLGNDPSLKQISKTMLGDYGLSHTCDEDRAALFKAGRWLTDTEVTTPVERSGWAQVDSGCATMVRYAGADVLDDAAIATRLPAFEPALMHRERTAQLMTARVSHRGLRLDGDQVAHLHAEHTEARDRLADDVRRLSGGVVENPASDAQVGDALLQLGAGLPRTKTGKASVAKSALTPLKAQDSPAGALAAAMLDYREHATALKLFLEPYRELVANGDGRARPTVYTLGADTGRMSCVRPNVQQMPRKGGFRACFTADPGQLLISADFAQVELRVAAALSGDVELARILADPERDVHMEIARLAFGPQATKEHRYLAKPMVFGRLYGSGAVGLARDNGVSPEIAQQIIDAMDRLTPQLASWSAQRRYAVDAGYLQFPTYSGRVVQLGGIRKRPHAAPNYAIQGTARELLVDALLRWSKTPWGTATLFPVHDELVVLVPEDEAEQATAALVGAMTSTLNGLDIVAEASTPTFAWADSV